MKNKILYFVILITLLAQSSFAADNSNRPLNDITLQALKATQIKSGEFGEYVLKIKDDLGNNLNGSYILELFNNTSNENINLIPRENFYYFKDGEVNISFQVFGAGTNEIIINVDNGRGKRKVDIFIEPSEEPYTTNLLNDIEYSYLETVLPLKNGDNRIRIYLKDKSGNKIKEGNYSFKVYSEIFDFDGRTQEDYFIEDKIINNLTNTTISGDIIKNKGYIEFLLKIPEVIDKNDGISLIFYLENGQRMNPVLNYFSDKEVKYENIPIVGFKNELILQIDSNKAEVNKFVIFIDAPPKLINDTTMVPLRLISDFLGIKVEWISEDNGVRLTSNNDKEIFLRIGSTEGLTKSVVPPFIIKGRTYVPLRYIGENFHSLVIWDGGERKIIIKN